MQRLAAVFAIGLSIGWVPLSHGFPIHGEQTVLPEGTELDEDALARPREIFKSEAHGKPYRVNLGDLAFSSPTLLGGAARRAGISCSTCHVNGASNARLFVPGMSSHPGNFDTTGAFFNPPSDDHRLDPLTIPSLRGARLLAPYGHDGRFASLRDFVRNVVVNEFAGAEPSPAILDAIVAYIEDIEFLPNPRIRRDGQLARGASAAARRGAVLFARPFPHDPGMSCASCHLPANAFVDHSRHDVGSGGSFKTPTLLNANFNAPYFHDGRFESYAEVVSYFDREFGLGLGAADRQDLVAYLNAVGDGERGEEPDSIEAWMKEIGDFASVLATAIPARDDAVVKLTVETVGTELRELIEHFPDHKDTSVSGGREERRDARAALKDLVLNLRRIDLAATGNDFDTAALEYRQYMDRAARLATVLKRAESWSLFNTAIHDAHYNAMRQVADTAKGASP